MDQSLFSDEPAPKSDDPLFSSEPAPQQIGGLESFGRGAANNFPLAPQAIAGGEALVGDKGYSENLSDWNAKAQAAKAANPKTYGAGAVTGAVAPLLIPGVGEALEASPIAGNALYGAANAISNTDLSKNPKEALKQAAIGGGLGAVSSKLAGALTPEASTLENAANKAALKSINLPSGELVDMTPVERGSLAQFLRENGMVGMDKEKALNNARDLLDDYGTKIGDLGDRSQELGLSMNPAEHYQAVQGLIEKSQQYSQLANREAKSLARNYKSGAQDILSLPENPKWSDIQRLKDQYGGLAFKSTGEVKDEAAKDTYFTLKDMLSGIAQKAHENENMPAEYKTALAGYSKMHPVVSGLEKAVDAELRGGGHGSGHGIIGLIKKMPGPLRTAIGAAGLATGHPHYAMAAALPEMMNPALHSQAFGAMARNAPALRQGLTQELSDFLSSKYNKSEGIK